MLKLDSFENWLRKSIKRPLLSSVLCNWTQPKKIIRFCFESPLKKAIKPTKNPTLYFSFEKMHYEVKRKISSTLVQL